MLYEDARFTRQASGHRGTMRPMLRRILPAAIAFVVAWTSCETRAVAADPDDLVEARTMANAAADDLEALRFEDALKKAERAEKLYHAPPHVLMIAEAYEGLGRLVEAWNGILATDVRRDVLNARARLERAHLLSP